MKIRLVKLLVNTRKTQEVVEFSDTVTFIYGPVGTGKSSVARLIDYCFGGELERTPAIQKEFVSAVLMANLGNSACTIERGALDGQSVRVTWTHDAGESESVSAPIAAGNSSLVDNAEVYNLSDLLFYLCGVQPIKVPKRARDPESPLVRLSFRDIWWYCYLDQITLDSSFYHLEDHDYYRARKSQDAMRFFTGLHSERMSQLQADYYKTATERQGVREAITQIRQFMHRFNLVSDIGLVNQISAIREELRAAEDEKRTLEERRVSDIHPTDHLRAELRKLSNAIADLRGAISDSRSTLVEQEALRAELITTKVKAGRAEEASRVLSGVEFLSCPECGSDISGRPHVAGECRLCGSRPVGGVIQTAIDPEVVRLELNERIDQISDSIKRRQLALQHLERELELAEKRKSELDRQLQVELERYDSAFIESIRAIDRKIATLEERLRSLEQLQEMPKAIQDFEDRIGKLDGRLERLRSAMVEERGRLRAGEEAARAIAEKFKSIMIEVGFPGISPDDEVVLDTQNWKPVIVHGEQRWSFWDTGSGGKKTLFNVCYALAVHEVARERGLPVPNVLIIDSPTKNISDDVNPELVQSLYRQIYRVAANRDAGVTQMLLIDSDLVLPDIEVPRFLTRRMAGSPDAPSLISYYVGP